MKKYPMQLRLLLLAALVWLIYSNSLDNDFHFDDFHVITDNPAVRGISDIPSFFLDSTTFSLLPGNRDYRPVFLTSMALSWQAGGGATLPFHLTSVLIHTGNVIVLFLILRLFFFTEKSLANKFPDKTKEWAALVGAGIFALHPLASEPVNYISSQSILLAAFFYLMSFYLFLTVYWRASSDSNFALWARRIGSYAAYFLAFLSKPIVITLGANLLLWELLFGKDLRTQKQPGTTLTHLWQRLRKHLPFWGLTLLALAIRQVLLAKPYGAPARAIWPHYLTQTKALVFYYLKHAFYPSGLNVDPEFTVSSSLFESNVTIAFLVLLAIAVVVYRLRQHRALVFWTLWFPVCLLVTTYLGILPQLVNEHRVYISMAGISALAGLFFAWLWHVFPVRFSDVSVGPHSGKILTMVFFLSIFIFLGLNTRARNKVWANDFTLWEDAAQNGGTWRAHMNYGLALENAGRSDEAFGQFKQAVEMFPGAYSHINLGLAYVRRNDMEKGIVHLRQAVSLWPDLPEAHLYLGYGLEQAGQIEEAEKELLEALRLRTNYLKGYRLLAEFYERQDKSEKARTAYQTVLKLDPAQSWAQERLTRLTTKKGRAPGSQPDLAYPQIAAGDYSTAIEILTQAYPDNPDHPELLFNLAFSQQMLENRTKAIGFYEALLKVAPNHVKGNFNLAFAYLAGTINHDLSRSAVLFKKVLNLSPGYSEALFRLASVYWKLGNETEARRIDALYLEKGVHEELKNRSRSRLARK